MLVDNLVVAVMTSAVCWHSISMPPITIVSC